MCHLLEQERQEHNQLKHTWQKANDQFLESQRLLMRDMQRMEVVLTSEQLRQVEELKKRDQVSRGPGVGDSLLPVLPHAAGPPGRVLISGSRSGLVRGKEAIWRRSSREAAGRSAQVSPRLCPVLPGLLDWARPGHVFAALL